MRFFRRVVNSNSAALLFLLFFLGFVSSQQPGGFNHHHPVYVPHHHPHHHHHPESRLPPNQRRRRLQYNQHSTTRTRTRTAAYQEEGGDDDNDNDDNGYYNRALQQQSNNNNNNNDDDKNEDDIQLQLLDPMSILRHDLLADYDRGSFPFELVWNNNNNNTTKSQSNNTQKLQQELRQGLNIELGINFHKVYTVDVANSVVDLIVWVRQSWIDPRLQWNPQDYYVYDGDDEKNDTTTTTKITKTWFYVQDGSRGGETTEIWVPDIELWNLETSLTESLVDTQAQVDYDGRVYWTRPGHLRAVCKFEGLHLFPFDELTCTMEFGSWTQSGLYIRPNKMDGTGYSIGGSETSGEAYAEYKLANVDCEQHIYPPYDIAPEEDWPVLFYHVTFERSWQPYVRGFLSLQILLNLVAFGCFWLPPHLGERMSLAITSLLAAVASELVVSSKLPAASEETWFSKFSVVSMIFAALVLFESVAVIYFYYHTGSDTTPRWLRYLITSRRVVEKKRTSKSSTPDDTNKASYTTNANNSSSKDSHEEEKKEEQREQTVGFYDLDETFFDNKEEDYDEDEGNNSQDNQQYEEEEEEEDESNNSNTDINTQEEDIMNHTSSSIQQGQQQQQNKSHHHHHHSTSSIRYRDLQRSESAKHRIAMFNSNLTGSTRKSIKTRLGRDADDFKSEDEMLNNIRWQEWSHNLDDFSRVFFPMAYAVFLAVMFANQ